MFQCQRLGNNVEDIGLLSSLMPRIAAVVCVALLIGSMGIASIGAVALFGPVLAHGNNTEHAAGQIVEVGPGEDFILKTASGKSISFECAAQCRASLGHLQRHLREHAHTDVYYIQGPGNALMVLDVD
jgi:hypothetical protein